MLRDDLWLYRTLLIEMEYFLFVHLEGSIPVACLAAHILNDALQDSL